MIYYVSVGEQVEANSIEEAREIGKLTLLNGINESVLEIEVEYVEE